MFIGQPELLTFVLMDTNDDEVTGLGSAFTVTLSKNGGAFAASAGTKAEIGDGWYSYLPTATEVNTAGPLALVITGAGVDQLNLQYPVSGSLFEAGAGTHILTTEEAAAVLRCAEDDPVMLMLLPGVDAYILQATGRQWELDVPIREEAKNAARIALVLAHEDPGARDRNTIFVAPSWGLTACLMQLEVLALTLANNGVPEEAFAVVSSMPKGGGLVAIGANLVVVFNHVLATGEADEAVLKDAAGSTVATTNAVDVTGKIVTVNPDANLNPGASYTLDLDGVADVYGMELDDVEISFWTAD